MSKVVDFRVYKFQEGKTYTFTVLKDEPSLRQRAIEAFKNPSKEILDKVCNSKLSKREGPYNYFFDPHKFVTKRKYLIFKETKCIHCGYKLTKETK